MTDVTSKAVVRIRKTGGDSASHADDISLLNVDPLHTLHHISHGSVVKCGAFEQGVLASILTTDNEVLTRVTYHIPRASETTPSSSRASLKGLIVPSSGQFRAKNWCVSALTRNWSSLVMSCDFAFR
ncbi:hypothetical protein EVAR_43925_1 [Eumeta japonica]|uniref:Uncharacterized protein n=1 Tax=Eumeta variegata TaxID=151549 RepID=A0A4C1WRI6_EUMVA|nr:hypothetical protein EVAR_43925_1 [Eumeta japonica]